MCDGAEIFSINHMHVHSHKHRHSPLAGLSLTISVDIALWLVCAYMKHKVHHQQSSRRTQDIALGLVCPRPIRSQSILRFEDPVCPHDVDLAKVHERPVLRGEFDEGVIFAFSWRSRLHVVSLFDFRNPFERYHVHVQRIVLLFNTSNIGCNNIIQWSRARVSVYHSKNACSNPSSEGRNS